MGPDVLPEDQKLIIEIAKVVRVGYLQQNAFHKDDTYVPMEKQLKMMEVILYLNKRCKEAVNQGKVVRRIVDTGIFDQVIKINMISLMIILISWIHIIMISMKQLNL